jgi:hypothetical protein
VEARTTLLGLLETFPSCCPPVEALLEHLPRLQVCVIGQLKEVVIFHLLLNYVHCLGYFFITSVLVKRNVYRLLVGKPEGKRPLGIPRCRWIDNIKMDLLEIGLNVVVWIGLAQDRYRWRALVSSLMNLRVP